jgi:hypothetical protein
MVAQALVLAVLLLLEVFVFTYNPHPLRWEELDLLLTALYSFCALRVLIGTSFTVQGLGHGLDDRRIVGSGKNSFLLQSLQTISGVLPFCYSVGSGGALAGNKPAGA